MRFVVLKHIKHGCDTHFDLMIETHEGCGLLTTYSLPVEPQRLVGDGSAECKRIFDHDAKFLTYQGAVNKGTGSVERVDEGTASRLESGASIRYTFDGLVLKGEFELIQVDGDRYKIQAV